MPSGRIAKVLTLLLLAAPPAVAQGEQHPVYSVWWSAGWNAPVANGSNIGHDRNLTLAGMERRFTITAGRFGRLSWAPAVLPVVRASNNRQLNPRTCGTNGITASTDEPSAITLHINGKCYQSFRYSAFGFGLLPVAFRWETSTERRVGLIADLDGGGVRFNHRLPVSSGQKLNGTLFNFVARGGIDAVVRVTDRTWISAGYRHMHLSNGGLGEINPGIDAPLMALGIAWR
jgi:hypothetical protein